MKRAIPYSSAVLALVLLAGGCAITAPPKPPAPEVPDRYISAPDEVAAPLEAEWWTRFDDPALTATIEDVLATNLDIEAALTRLEEAGALQDAFRSDLYPTIDGFADADAAALLTSPNGSDATVDATAGASVAFDPDISGRNRLNLQAAIAQFRAEGYAVADARRLAARAAALQYIELRRAGARLALLETSVGLQERTLEIVTARYDAGLSPALDVDRAAADLARTEASRELLRASRRQASFALSALAGRVPEEVDRGDPEEDIIPEVTAPISPGMPSDLLRNRPDVQRAEALLQAELAALGAERADLLPSLRLPGTISAGVGDLLDNPSESAVLSLSALVDIPLFDAGRRRAEIRAQSARADAAYISWRAAVISAVTDVEFSLVRIAALQSQLAQFEKAETSSENAYRQLDALYREGLAGFIDVLDAQRTLISTRETLVDIKASLATEWVELASAFHWTPVCRDC